jgi:uncharacterized damage-inducible protein DinB
MTTTEDLRYPVGTYSPQTNISSEELKRLIETFERFPSDLRKTVENLGEEQLDTPYRNGGWTVRQVVHHVVDSHMNGYVRMKLALTENNPTIKPYHEARWAELDDYRTTPLSLSLDLLELLHRRWVIVMRALTPEQLNKKFFHPDNGEEMTLFNQIGLYAWHSEHHMAHITSLLKRKGWG